MLIIRSFPAFFDVWSQIIKIYIFTLRSQINFLINNIWLILVLNTKINLNLFY